MQTPTAKCFSPSAPPTCVENSNWFHGRQLGSSPASWTWDTWEVEAVLSRKDCPSGRTLAADFIHYLEGNLKDGVLPEIKMHLVYDLAIQNSNSFQRVKEESGIVYRGFSSLWLNYRYSPDDVGLMLVFTACLSLLPWSMQFLILWP